MLKMGDFIPLFLVRFPYNYLGENESFKPYITRDSKMRVLVED